MDTTHNDICKYCVAGCGVEVATIIKTSSASKHDVDRTLGDQTKIQFRR